jgi:hypothetical protein
MPRQIANLFWRFYVQFRSRAIRRTPLWLCVYLSTSVLGCGNGDIAGDGVSVIASATPFRNASPAVCGENFSAALGGCWLEPPQDNADLPGPDATEPLLVQAWNGQVALSLPDRDVFTIDVNQDPPALVPSGEFRRVGTTLFAMAVHPKTGKIFVGNTDARNAVRFEGPGDGVAQDGRFASTTVRGHARARLALLLARGLEGDCDLVAHSSDHGFTYSDGAFVRDDGARFSPSRLEERVIARGAVTFTAVPPGEGIRSGIDRDEDGRLDKK